MYSYRPGGFQTLSPGVKNILIINIIFFIVQSTIGARGNMDDVFALHHVRSPLFQPWQIVTHMFMHADFMHILGNMFGLWIFGSELENLWGSKRFLTFYFLCGIGAALIYLTYQWFDLAPLINDFALLKAHPTTGKMILFLEEYGTKYPNLYLGTNGDNILQLLQQAGTQPEIQERAFGYVNYFTSEKINTAMLGASGAVYGLIAAYVYLFPNRTFYLNFLFPIQAKWFALIYFVPTLIGALSPSQGDNIAHWAHLGGGLVGFLLVLTWNKRNRSTFY